MVIIPVQFSVAVRNGIPCPPLTDKCGQAGAPVGIVIRADSASKLADPGRTAIKGVIASDAYLPANPAAGRPTPLWEYDIALADDIIADGETLTAADFEGCVCLNSIQAKWNDQRFAGPGVCPDLALETDGDGNLNVVCQDTILFTIPVAVSDGDVYVTGITINENTVALARSDGQTLSANLPSDKHVTSLAVDGNTLILEQSGGAPDFEVTLPSTGGGGGSGVTIGNGVSTSESALQAEFGAQAAAGVVARWTDNNGVARVSVGKSAAWTHLYAQQAVVGVVAPFTPNSRQTLSTTYTDIAGSSFSYTPKSANSRILYRFAFHMAGPTLNERPMAHFRLVSGGVAVANTTTTIYAGEYRLSGVYGSEDEFVIYEQALESWGQSARILKLQGRSNSETTDSKVHETFRTDGANVSQLVKATLTIFEFLV
jgi:hypothetical protein